MSTAARWKDRLEVSASTPGGAGALLSYLVGILEELRTPGLDPTEVTRLRAAIYGVSVGVKCVETAELTTEVERLRQIVEGPAA